MENSYSYKNNFAPAQRNSWRVEAIKPAARSQIEAKASAFCRGVRSDGEEPVVNLEQLDN